MAINATHAQFQSEYGVDSDGTALTENLVVTGTSVTKELVVAEDVTIAGNTVVFGDIQILGNLELGSLPLQLSSLQKLLISGTNIKTVNGASLLGAGNIEVAASSGSSGGGTGDVSLTGTQTLTNKTFGGGTKEIITVLAYSATGTVNYDVLTQQVLYWTSNASANWTLNIRGSTLTSLNSIMAVGEVMSVILMNTNGATPYYNNSLTIDGVAITPRWETGAVPTAGNASSIDVYSYTIIKTAVATYTILGAQTKFV